MSPSEMNSLDSSEEITEEIEEEPQIIEKLKLMGLSLSLVGAAILAGVIIGANPSRTTHSGAYSSGGGSGEGTETLGREVRVFSRGRHFYRLQPKKRYSTSTIFGQPAPLLSLALEKAEILQIRHGRL